MVHARTAMRRQGAFGVAGFGPYYQIRTEPQSIPDYLCVGDEIVVLLSTVGEENYAVLEFGRQSKQVQCNLSRSRRLDNPISDHAPLRIQLS
jgi:hypothetical protein